MDVKNKKKILELIEWRKGLGCINGMENYYWDPLIELLSKNEVDTIKFLGECSDEQIYWISEVFEDISDKFQSKGFVDFLKELQKAHPNVDIKQDIQSAEYRLAEE